MNKMIPSALGIIVSISAVVFFTNSQGTINTKSKVLEEISVLKKEKEKLYEERTILSNETISMKAVKSDLQGKIKDLEINANKIKEIVMVNNIEVAKIRAENNHLILEIDKNKKQVEYSNTELMTSKAQLLVIENTMKALEEKQREKLNSIEKNNINDNQNKENIKEQEHKDISNVVKSIEPEIKENANNKEIVSSEKDTINKIEKTYKGKEILKEKDEVFKSKVIKSSDDFFESKVIKKIY